MTNDTAPTTKADLNLLEDRLLRAIAASEERVKHYFDVKAEQLTDDYRGAFNDKVEVFNDKHVGHERRIKRLERHAGFIA